MSLAREYRFRKIFEENSKKVFNICLNIIQNKEDAEDLTQEVFIEIFHSFDKFEGKSELSTWIYRIAVNKCLDFIKAKKRKKRFAVMIRLFHRETGNMMNDVPHFEHPGVLLENRERAEILFSAISLLPENQKASFILFHIEGFSCKETAQIMKLSEKAVESLLQRARGNLKKHLGNFYDGRRIP